MKYVTQTKIGQFLKEELKYMSPEKFLKLSQPLSIEDDIFAENTYEHAELINVRNKLVKEVKQNPLKLTVDADTGEVINQRGRHVAYAAYQFGIKELPVFIKYIMYDKNKGRKPHVVVAGEIPDNIEIKRGNKRKRQKPIEDEDDKRRWVHG
jgi:hypothetical protein